MKHLYAILIALSLATQGMATPLAEGEGSAQPVAKTAGVTQESALSRWVSKGKTAAFWVAGVSVLPVAGCIQTQNQNQNHGAKDNKYLKMCIIAHVIGSVVGLGLGVVETALKRGRNLSPNQSLARDLMIAAPAVALPVACAKSGLAWIYAPSIIMFLSGALWSMKDWYQKWRQPKANPEVEISQNKALA
jgi:hypothetical protein